MRPREVVQNIVVCLVNDGVNIILLRWMSGVDSLCAMLIMKGVLLLTLVYLVHCEGAVVVRSDEHAVVNDRPIIGVLSQEQSIYLHTKYPEENYTSYIAASYVKDVEASGARVVPILIGKDRAYYEELLGKLNGVLIPGGATYFNQTDGYADAGQHIYEIAQQLNDAGDYFPIFGTCLGFELLIILASGRGYPENRITCYSHSNIPLNFTEDFHESKMFKEAPEDVLDVLANEDVTVNAHQFCIIDENLKSHNLTHDWRVTSHSDDDNGVKFIASVEHTRYPFYGVQFHPEKSSFEWKKSKNYSHSINAVKANRYFMDFFVKECRKNAHAFASQTEENHHYRVLNASYPRHRLPKPAFDHDATLAAATSISRSSSVKNLMPRLRVRTWTARTRRTDAHVKKQAGHHTVELNPVRSTDFLGITVVPNYSGAHKFTCCQVDLVLQPMPLRTFETLLIKIQPI